MPWESENRKRVVGSTSTIKWLKPFFVLFFGICYYGFESSLVCYKLSRDHFMGIIVLNMCTFLIRNQATTREDKWYSRPILGWDIW